MNLILAARDVLGAISPKLVDELDGVITRVNIVWAKQHNPQTGAHTFISVQGVDFQGDTQATVGGAGGASALPGTPTGYIEIDGIERVIPYYAKS